MNAPAFRTVFDELPAPYIVVDRELRIVATNRAYDQAVNRTREGLIGQPLFSIFPDDGESGRRVKASFEQVLRTGESDTLAYLRYAIPAADGTGLEDRYWTTTHTPIMGEDGAVAFIVQNALDVTEIAQLRETQCLPFRQVPAELALFEHAREVEEAYQETVSEAVEFRRLFRQAPGMIAVLDGPDHVIHFANDSFVRFCGNRDLIGRPVREAIPELEGQGFFRELDSVYVSGQSRAQDGARVEIDPHRGVDGAEAFLDYSFNPIRDPRGDVTGVFVQCTDRTEFMQAVERQRHLIDELNHRVKNTLSTVQSMARQSFRKLSGATEARYAFEARLMALSQVHNILAARRWQAAEISVILREELSTVAPERVSTAGPDLSVTARAAIALAIVFHELASNANRYGALAADGGCLDVRWSIAGTGDGRHLQMTWTERMDGADALELTEGLGLRMVRRIIEGELGGRFGAERTDDGVTCRFDIAVAEMEEVAREPV